jgi:transcriptional regulator with PAS, ATPase and Fis domain
VRKIPLRPEPRLVLVCECDRPLARGASWSLTAINELIVGRGERRAARRDPRDALRIEIPSRSMSSAHARLTQTPDGWLLEDLESRNGTFVDGERVTRAWVRPGDVLELGRALFVITQSVVNRTGVDIDGETLGTPQGLATVVPELAARYDALARIARSKVPVLLLGETGTGKEVLAGAVHALSGRSGRFVAVNCGALPESLVEAQLFGHVKGAFSGATRDEPGLVRAADGGTLFLDEIGDLPASSQAALLRVLQEEEVVPVGSTRPVPLDLRVVAATHRSLSNEAARGAFRDDLLARISGFALELLPLRKRKEDLGMIVGDLLRSLAGDRAHAVSLTPNVARALLAHDYPYNVRELRQALATALVLADDGLLSSDTLPASIAGAAARLSSSPPPRSPACSPEDDETLAKTLVAQMHQHRGNVAAVARAMGKAPMQIHRWFKRFGLDPDTYR